MQRISPTRKSQGAEFAIAADFKRFNIYHKHNHTPIVICSATEIQLHAAGRDSYTTSLWFTTQCCCETIVAFIY